MRKTSKLTIFYSVQNGGDGSAYPQFMESKELAEWDQDHMDEGWGESCDGSLVVESDSQGHMECNDTITAAAYYLEKMGDYDEEYPWEDKKDFEDTFFPNGIPELVVKIRPEDDSYYYIYEVTPNEGWGERYCYKDFAYRGEKKSAKTTEKGRNKLEKQLNGYKDLK